MFLVGVFQWWYGAGLRWWHRQLLLGMVRTADFFSIGLLAQTLFSPFRQISAGATQGPLPVQLRAFFDRTFSRVFGAFLRTIMIIVGLCALLVRALLSLLGSLGWMIMPVTPILGVALWLMGVSL